MEHFLGIVLLTQELKCPQKASDKIDHNSSKRAIIF